MDFDRSLSESYCIYGAWRCTVGEALGQASVLLFLMVVHVVSIARGCFGCCGGLSESGTGHGQRPQTLAMNDCQEIIEGLFCLYSFFLWPLGFYFLGPLLGVSGAHWAHPLQHGGAQATGAALALLCALAFLGTHFSLGRNWISRPGVKENHGLVTRGLFGCARHPMYAVFAWFAVATALATLNWVLTLMWFPMLLMLTRIRYEEEDMINTFGEEYRAYQQRVSALGPPLCCLFRPPKGEPLLGA